MWVYTEYGEKVGQRYGVSRTAGQPAMCGYEPVKGITAKAWEKSGYIEWKDDTEENDAVTVKMNEIMRSHESTDIRK